MQQTFRELQVQWAEVRMEGRPKAVPVVAGFLFAASVVAVVVGCSLLFPGKLLNWFSQFNERGMTAFERLGNVSGALLLALAAGTAAAGAGLLGGRKWAWWLAVTLFAVNACGDLVGLFLMRDAVRGISGVVVSSIFLYALVRRGTRSYVKTHSHR